MPPAQDYNQTFEDAGAAWNVDPSLLRAIIKGESGNQGSAATSSKGAQGIAQFMPATARSIGMTNTRDPEQSIWGAAKLMSQNLDLAKGDVPTALKIYQGGPNRDIWGPENAAYPAYIMSKYKAAGPANDAAAPAPAAAAAPAQPSGFDAAYGKGSSTTPAPAPATDAPQPSGFDAAYGPGSAPAATDNTPPKQGGLLANAAAGLAQGGKGLLNVMQDPVGRLLVDPAETMGRFGYNALAGAMGGQQVNPEPQLSEWARGKAGMTPLGDRVGNALSNATGVDFSGVEGQTPLERIVRSGATGLAMGGPFGLVGAGAGVVGGIAAEGAQAVVPDWAGPAAGLAAGMVGGAGVMRGAGALSMPNRLTAAAEPAAAARVEPRLNSAGPAPVEPVTPGSAAPGGPTPGMGAPAPGNLSAAATPDALLAADAAGMTVRQGKAMRVQNENMQLREPILDGRDEGGYIPGVVHTAAAVTGDSDVAALQKHTFQGPGEKDLADKQQASNTYLRKEAYLDNYDNPITNERKQSELYEQSAARTDKLWANKKAADASPTLDMIDGLLNGPRGEVGAVADNLARVRAKLIDSEGNLKTDPERLAGVREDLSNIINAKDFSASAPAKAGIDLMKVRDSLDSSIETGAPGWTARMKELSDGLGPINASKLLDNAFNGLTSGPGRNMTFGSFDRFMKTVVRERDAPGANDYKSISAEQMDRLFAIHSDLALEQRGTNGGKVAGSDTSMLGRIGGALSGVAQHAVVAGAGAAMGVPPLVSNAIYKAGMDQIRAGRSGQLAASLRDGANYAQPPAR